MYKPVVFSLCLLLAGCGGAGNLPTSAQVEFNLPSSLRACPSLPASPGQNATQRQTAAYLVRLYSAADRCRKNNGEVDRLYQQYRGQIQRVAATVRRIAAGRKSTKVAKARARTRTAKAHKASRRVRTAQAF